MEFRDYWQEYGAKSYKIDKSKKAKKVFDLEKITTKGLGQMAKKSKQTRHQRHRHTRKAKTKEKI